MNRALALLAFMMLLGGCETAADRQYRDLQRILEHRKMQEMAAKDATGFDGVIA